MFIMAVKKLRTPSGFVIYSYFNMTVHLKQLNVNRRFMKGVPFLSKMIYKRVRGWTLG